MFLAIPVKIQASSTERQLWIWEQRVLTWSGEIYILLCPPIFFLLGVSGEGLGEGFEAVIGSVALAVPLAL